jgi:hypothetical protein
MGKRSRVGDVLEIAVPEGRLYLHYLGVHPQYGDGVAVCPKRFPDPVVVEEKLFDSSYVVFYPARAAVVRGLAKVVGQLPSRGLPRRLRRPGVRRGNKVETWIIEEDSREEMKRLLSEQDLRIPLSSIWNHEFLVQRVLEGWRPEHEGRADDLPARGAPEELCGSSGREGAHMVVHYLYFPDHQEAVAAASELRSAGYTAEERLGADGIKWLVRARHEIVRSEESTADLRRSMEDLAERHRGEYDGWEADVGPLVD